MVAPRPSVVERRPLSLPVAVVNAMRTQLPKVADAAVAAIAAEVTAYAGPLTGRLGTNIHRGVAMALDRFLDLTQGSGDGPGRSLQEASSAARELGAGEARSGRSLEALLSAYRVGARVSWRGLSEAAVDAGLPAADIAQLAEAVFAYIDELSASSAAGHAEVLSTVLRERERRTEQLVRLLLTGATSDRLTEAAEHAGWTPPATLTAVLLPAGEALRVASGLDRATLLLTDEPPGTSVLLVPDLDRVRRARLLALLPAGAVLGPPRPWTAAAVSYRRTLRAREVLAPRSDGVLDTEAHLAALVVHADPSALQDLQAAVLAPLAEVRPATRERLLVTLRAWLLHQGRRDEVARELFVHPQTVRYRIGQLRDLYGERLNDPRTVEALVLALAGGSTEGGSAATASPPALRPGKTTRTSS